MTEFLKTKGTQQLVPVFVALTLLYSLVYHIMMFRAVLEEDITQDDCDKRRHAGGIVPPQCLELDVFKDWHEKDMQELLVESTPPRDHIQADPTVVSKQIDTVVIVDKSGGWSISEDLAGLEEKFSQLDEQNQIDVNVAAAPDVSSATAMPLAKNMEPLQDLMQHELGDHKNPEDIPAPAEGQVQIPADFAAFHAQMEASHKKRVGHKAVLMQEIAQRMAKLDMKLSDVVSDRKAWEATLLEKYDAADITGQKHIEPVSSPPSTFMPKRLQWSVMPTIHHHKVANHKFSPAKFLEAFNKRPLVVSKSEVRHLHWTGNLPKVAAITWIRGDRKTKARMMYFVDNFKLQDYEGARQLVLVYHQQDTIAAEIVRKYANDTDITSVAAHDFSRDMFPSDPALRYAAWDSDADVIAQWDFDEWHDPSRLSLQVRAMAHTSKQACVLSTSSTSHSQADESTEISVPSLVGERSWMKDHWHPIGRSFLINVFFQGGELVEMDMQNKALMGNISHIEHVFVEAKKPASPAKQDSQSGSEEAKGETKDKSGVKQGAEQGTEFSRGITECLNYDKSSIGDHAAEAAAEKAINENVGGDFRQKFHRLVVRRHDITQKLQLLCFETTMEKDMGKHKFMHEHVLEMDHIRSELDKHIKSMASLFSAPKLQ